LLPLPAGVPAASLADPGFVPLLVEPALPLAAPAPAPTSPATEVEVAGAVVRVRPGMDAALLTSVLRAVRASAVLSEDPFSGMVVVFRAKRAARQSR
jgi:hypothetical protein